MSDTNFSWIRPDNTPLEALLTLRLGSKASLRGRRKETRRQLAPTMDPRMWHKVAAISGVAAIGLGTYGAHGFRPKNPSYKEVWRTASLYHLVHTAALVGAPITKHPNIFGGLLTTGIVGFSGTSLSSVMSRERPEVASTITCKKEPMRQVHVIQLRKFLTYKRVCVAVIRS
ncbi:hypothetical protein MUK42_04592 [Musa troglodytarum]|uniref:Transmembrane protein 256 homolog n=1 Tax=Musa troglodytarum TaxID=320322 RepID=A0A9E7G8J0_9LILI|nr:hypothetical protein MUK42_04592 [Musa troglodytarum]